MEITCTKPVTYIRKLKARKGRLFNGCQCFRAGLSYGNLLYRSLVCNIWIYSKFAATTGLKSDALGVKISLHCRKAWTLTIAGQKVWTHPTRQCQSVHGDRGGASDSLLSGRAIWEKGMRCLLSKHLCFLLSQRCFWKSRMVLLSNRLDYSF